VDAAPDLKPLTCLRNLFNHADVFIWAGHTQTRRFFKPQMFVSLDGNYVDVTVCIDAEVNIKVFNREPHMRLINPAANGCVPNLCDCACGRIFRFFNHSRW
jgi:hypothetical protein